MPFDALVLSLAKMNRIRGLDAPNATLTAEAGVVLADVQAAAADAGFLFPLSLASEGSCRIGGTIGSNAGGTAVLRYGNMRDLVLGLEVVLADGRVWNGLKALRKDNAGYDLKHLFIGSEGTLGIVTAASLKLFPAVRARTVAFVGAADPAALMTTFERARTRFGASLSAFEFLPRFGLEMVLRRQPGTADPLADPHAWYALIEASSTSDESGLDAAMEDALGGALEDGLIADATIAQGEAQARALWSLREALSDAQGFEGGSIKHDVSLPLSALPGFLERTAALCERELPGLRVCAFGHLGDGNVHFNLSQPVGMEKAAFLALWRVFNRIVHDEVVAANGSIAAEHGVGLIKRDELAHYKDAVTMDLLRAVKAALDPRDLLNPGKVVAMPGRSAPPALPGRSGAVPEP